MTTPPIIINPLPWGDATPFWEATSRGELCVPQCPETGRFFFPPSPVSPFGSHRPTKWVGVSGRATLWSFVVADPPLVGQFDAVAPYVTAVVELDDAPGLRLVGALVAGKGEPLGSLAAADVVVGMPLEVDLTVADGTTVVPRWMPART